MYRCVSTLLSGVPFSRSLVDLPRSMAVALAVFGMMAQEVEASFRSQLFESAFLSFETGGNPVSVALGDLDGDQRLDLVLQGGLGVMVHMGRVDGLFGPGTEYPTTPSLLGTHGLELVDLNGDSVLDIVSVESDLPDGWVGILLGTGDGTFGAATLYAVSGDPSQTVVADLNGDQNLDLAVVNRSDATVSILLGDGTGSFAPAIDYATGGQGPYSLDVGDLNGDSKPDLAFANAISNTITILRGEGDGTFPTPLILAIPASTEPRAILVRDINSDQDLDLVFSDYQDGNVSFLLGNGDGSFLLPRQDLSTGAPSARAVEVADVDGNGTQDLAVATDSGLSVLLGDGVGGFGVAELAHNAKSVSLALGQLDNDGNLDAVVDHTTFDSYSVLLGNGDGTFGDTANDIGVGLNPASVATGHMDADGNIDLVVANSGDGEPGQEGLVTVHRGNGDGTFQSRINHQAGEFPTSVKLADFDGDNALDAAVANGGVVFRFCGPGETVSCCDPLLAQACVPVNEAPSMTVSVLLGEGDATLGPKDDYVVGDQPRWVETADLNADLVPDLVTANPDDHTVSVLLGVGDGTFEIKTDYATGFSPRALAIEDVNGDLFPDLIVACTGSDSVSVLQGTGDGTFGVATNFDSGDAPFSVEVAELTGDSNLDLVVGGNPVTLLAGNGDGTFGAPVALAFNGFTTVADVDLDSFLDVVVAMPGRRVVWVLYGAGGGLFDEQMGYGLDQNAFFITTADVDANGWPDLVVPKYSDDEVQVMVNRASATDVVWGRPSTLVRLRPSWPNPVRGTSQIEFSLPTQTQVSLRVFDVRGRLVRTLLRGARPAGSHVLSWDLRSAQGTRVASGVYFYELRWPQGRKSRSLVVAD